MDMERVRDDAADLIAYVPKLAKMLEPGSKRIDEDAEHHKVSASPAPWNSPVAAVYTDIHAVRALETELLAALADSPARGSSHANTAAALRVLPDLIAMVATRNPNHPAPKRAARYLRRTGLAARQALDDLRPNEEPWQRAPGGLVCPNYGTVEDGFAGEEYLVDVTTLGDETPQVETFHRCDLPLMLKPGFVAQLAPAVYCRRCKDENGRLLSYPYEVWVQVVTEPQIPAPRAPSDPPEESTPTNTHRQSDEPGPAGESS